MIRIVKILQSLFIKGSTRNASTNIQKYEFVNIMSFYIPWKRYYLPGNIKVIPFMNMDEDYIS